MAVPPTKPTPPPPASDLNPTPAVPATAVPEASFASEPDYLPQYQITGVPVLPVDQILARIEYPPLAAKLGIEATVYLELYIDQDGVIRKIVVLKNPGYGFAEAAVKALQNVVAMPASTNGKPVAVRFRYPIRFTLK